MRKKSSELIVIIFFGLIFPTIMLSLIFQPKRKSPNNTSTIPSTSVSSETDDHMIRLLDADGNITDLSLEEYVMCVVLKEMPSSFGIEAIKSQAVASRTYTLFRCLKQDKHIDADVCTDPSCCQAYISTDAYLSAGGKKEDIDRIAMAVADTKGLVMYYGGTLIEATYFSASGGMTESAVEVWGSDVPYLRATDSPGEEGSAYHSETTFISAETLRKALNISLNADGTVSIRDIQYTDGRGIDTIRICGKIFTGLELRKLLRLRSTAITITPTGNGISVTTKGYGHRVGMSQYGADAMARAGHTFTEILSHYYSDVQIRSIEESNLPDRS